MKPQARLTYQLPAPRGPGRQRGVVLFFALIVLVILLIGGVIAVRAINASLFSAGNLAFRRDVVTQSDAVVTRAMQLIAAAGTANSNLADTTTSYPTLNYSAQVLPTNAQGIPTALVNDSTFNSVGNAGNDILGPTGSQITIRYVIERMCNVTGAASATNCVPVLGNPSNSGTTQQKIVVAASSVVYRLSARVTGPRGTQGFFQTMFSGPG